MVDNEYNHKSTACFHKIQGCCSICSSPLFISDFLHFASFPQNFQRCHSLKKSLQSWRKNNTQLESDEQAKQRRLEEAESQTQRGSGDGGSNSQSTSLQIEDVTDNKLSGKAHRQKLINKTFCQKLIILINFKKK